MSIVISGSLRKDSKNRAIARSIVNILQEQGLPVEYFEISSLPMHSQDLEDPLVRPESVNALYKAIGNVERLIIVTPENNFMPSAPIVNTIAWLSRGQSPPLKDKKIVIFSGAGRSGGMLAQKVLRDALETCTKFIPMTIVPETVAINLFDGKQRFVENSEGLLILQDPENIDEIRKVLQL